MVWPAEEVTIYGAYVTWMKVGPDVWMLGAEAGTVMALRTARIATGGSAGAVEVEPMVTEKVRAAIDIQAHLMTGGPGTTALNGTRAMLKHYRRKVAAHNRRIMHSPHRGR